MSTTMNERIEKLKEKGCDIEEVMTRFLDDEAFYLECYDSVIRDPKFEELKELLERQDLKAAFECAHTLKGLTANLGLESLNQILVDMVEKLRNGSGEEILEEYGRLMSEREPYLRI